MNSSNGRLHTVFRKMIICVVIPTLLSAIIMFWNLTALGLSHWDEYNYIETAEWFLRIPGGAFTIYEPPGFPFIVALFFRLFGVRDYVAIAASGLFAVATVGFVAYLGLKLFDFEVGLTAAILLMLTPLLITYARMALTDTTFMFFYSLAAATMYFALKSGRIRTIAVAGIALSACTMTKFNAVMVAAVILFYFLISMLSVERTQKPRIALRQLKILILTCIPSLVVGILYISFLGLSTQLPASRLLSVHALKLAVLDAPTIFSDGLAKLIISGHHVGLLNFFPFMSATYYLQVLVYFVPFPVLLLAVVGLLRKDLSDCPELFVVVWLLGSFFIIASVGAQYSRAILPVLPPLALCASLGLFKISAFAQSLSLAHRPKVKLEILAPLLLILVIVFSFQGAYQAASVEHHGYREAAQLLTNAGGNVPALADAQPVIGFYHPVNFGEINGTNLSHNRYLVVDFVAIKKGYGPLIQQLAAQGRIRLIATIPADLPPEVYLDWMSFQQLEQWNYTNIQIYEITNSTATGG